MAANLALDLAGERVELLGDRALLWPARSRLLIADLHLGKADTFRRAGIALPSGGTAHDLERLSALIARTRARSLWVLGDLLHGAIDTRRWREQWNIWRAAHAALDVAVLAGNHDRALASAGLDARLLGDAVDEPPFAFRHAPEQHPMLHVVCGHLHPVSALPGVRRRWPVFWLREGLTVLPAFSQFTGGMMVDTAQSGRCTACVEGDAIAIPAPRD